MNLKELKEMINLMNEHNLTELEMERDDLKIRLKKAAAGKVEEEVIEKRTLPEKSASPLPPPVTRESLLQITSPMVGTFYRAPAPDAEPFVEVGDEIEVGKVVCIIEAMKLMNEIKAELKGKIKEVLVENGEPVEFGQPLFTLEAL